MSFLLILMPFFVYLEMLLKKFKEIDRLSNTAGYRLEFDKKKNKEDAFSSLEIREGSSAFTFTKKNDEDEDMSDFG